MTKAVDIAELNIDEVKYKVEDLPEDVQGLIRIYNEWNQKEVDFRDEIVIMQAAKETLSRQIIDKVRAVEASKKEPADNQPAEEVKEAPDGTV